MTTVHVRLLNGELIAKTYLPELPQVGDLICSHGRQYRVMRRRWDLQTEVVELLCEEAED